MFVILCRRLASNTQLGKFPFKPSFPFRFISSSSEISLNSNEEHSFTISYLINSCGLSPNSAKSVSSRCKFKTLAKPDSVLKFLRDYGFSGSQITETVRKSPELLNCKVEKTILPKLEFFYSIGVSKEILPKIIATNPNILRRSLKHCTLQYEIFKSILHSDDKVIRVFQRLTGYNLWRVQKFLVQNVSVVRELGMPDRFISKFVLLNHDMFLAEVSKFSEAVKKVVEMGFNPTKYSFAEALLVLIRTSAKRWESKIELLKRWGLSEDEFLLCFRRQPKWVLHAEDSIMSKMSFLVSNMGWKPEYVVRYPIILCLSLEKRIIPRCTVMRILFLKGLMKKEIGSPGFLFLTEGQFLTKFVNHNLAEVPHLVDVLQGKRISKN